MDQWNEQGGGGGGYFAEGAGTPTTGNKSKPAARQQFLCPVTIRQLLEAPEDGLKVGSFTATMVTLAGVVLNVNTSSTQVQFTVSDDTGVIECVDWMESEESMDVVKKRESLMEGNYYQIIGCLKSPQGKRRIMVFKVIPVEDFNMITAFMAEVLSVNRYAEKMNSGYVPMETTTNFPQSAMPSYGGSVNDVKSKLSLPQKEILDAIKAVESQIGWDKNDPVLRRKYSPQQIDNVIDYLVGEGYIYSTVDEDHYNHT